MHCGLYCPANRGTRDPRQRRAFRQSGASPRPRPARSRALVVPRQLTSVACFLAPNTAGSACRLPRLECAIHDSIEPTNAGPKSLLWTKSANAIVIKVNRGICSCRRIHQNKVIRSTDLVPGILPGGSKDQSGKVASDITCLAPSVQSARARERLAGLTHLQ